MKDYLRKLGNLRKQGKLDDKLQSDIKADYDKQKREIRKRLNEQFPNKVFDEEVMPELQPEPEKPKPDIDKVFNHVHQLLMNDEFVEDYFMLFGKHKDRIIIEIPVISHEYNVVITFKILWVIITLWLLAIRCVARSVTTLFPNLIPIIDILLENTISIF